MMKSFVLNIRILFLAAISDFLWIGLPVLSLMVFPLRNSEGFVGWIVFALFFGYIIMMLYKWSQLIFTKYVFRERYEEYSLMDFDEKVAYLKDL